MQEPKEKKISCAICRNKSGSGDSTLTFHPLPTNERYRKHWIDAIMSGCKDVNPLVRVNPGDMLCSAHFLPEDFRKKRGRSKGSKGANDRTGVLKLTSVPSVFFGGGDEEEEGDDREWVGGSDDHTSSSSESSIGSSSSDREDSSSSEESGDKDCPPRKRVRFSDEVNEALTALATQSPELIAALAESSPEVPVSNKSSDLMTVFEYNPCLSSHRPADEMPAFEAIVLPIPDYTYPDEKQVAIKIPSPLATISARLFLQKDPRKFMTDLLQAVRFCKMHYPDELKSFFNQIVSQVPSDSPLSQMLQTLRIPSTTKSETGPVAAPAPPLTSNDVPRSLLTPAVEATVPPQSQDHPEARSVNPEDTDGKQDQDCPVIVTFYSLATQACDNN